MRGNGLVRWLPMGFAIVASTTFGLAAAAGQATFAAGFGKADITPAEPVFMGGYAMRGTASAGLHGRDQLFARALALTDGTTRLVIVETDIIGIRNHEELRGQIAKATGLRLDCVILGDVHNHAAPAPGDKNAHTAWQKRFGEALVAAARQALGSLQPARLGMGSGHSRVAMNRRKVMQDTQTYDTFDENYASQTFGPFKTDQPLLLHEMEGVVRLGANPLGPIDDEVGVLRIDRADGRPLAVLINYACHGTSLGGRNGLICSEWMGHMLAAVEQAVPGVQAVFVQGAAGDINPRVVGGLDGYKDDPENTTALGREIAEEAVRVYAGTKTEVPRDPVIRLVSRTLELPRAYGELYEDYKRTTVDVPATALRVGDFTLVTFPGEMFHEIGLQVKRASPSKITFIAGYTNGSVGYMPTQAAFAEGGYEPDASHFAPQAEKLYLRQVAKLLAALR